MYSVARLCVLALTLLFHVGLCRNAWSSDSFCSGLQASRSDDGTPAQGGEDDAPEGTEDRSAPLADDIFEIAALPVAPLPMGADAAVRAGLTRDELCRGCPALAKPDKPPRA
ncbi:MAG: hypothetical protein RL685_1056 [Pseudomonadota bacterium]|jgi:hypothetical protein